MENVLKKSTKNFASLNTSILHVAIVISMVNPYTEKVAQEKQQAEEAAKAFAAKTAAASAAAEKERQNAAT